MFLQVKQNIFSTLRKDKIPICSELILQFLPIIWNIQYIPYVCFNSLLHQIPSLAYSFSKTLIRNETSLTLYSIFNLNVSEIEMSF